MLFRCFRTWRCGREAHPDAGKSWPASLFARPPANWPFVWLYAPTAPALAFALRNTIAATAALWIAFWMELSEPQWAAMTVWIVASGTRGESLSKGRWRMAGTLLGILAAFALVASFPQQPWLFLPALALWAGFCAACGTLAQNFRSYAFVLAS